MNEQAESTALTIRSNLAKVESALTEFEKIEAGLAELRTKYAGSVFDVKTGSGMKEAISARAEIREPRYKVEHARKAGKAPVLALGKNLDERAAYITEELLKIETPIHGQIAAEDSRKEAEREARERAGQERFAKIHAGIDEIKMMRVGAAGEPSAKIAALMDELEKNDCAWAQELRTAAVEAKVATMNRLNEMHAAAVNQEAEAARLKVEREELERQKAAQADREKRERELAEEGLRRRMADEKAAREKIETEERASRDRIEQEERAARLRQEETGRAARAQREADEAAAKAIRDEEEAKLRAERERLEKERLAKERRLREALAKAEAKAKAKRDKEEAAERDRLRKEADRMDARAMLTTFRERFGEIDEFAAVIREIDAYFESTPESRAAEKV
jgi:hypothetical protein